MTPNKFPSVQVPYKLAVIGEAPGRDEEQVGQPFMGASGRFLKALMSRAGIDPAGVFFGNVCNYRPPSNEIVEFAWDGPEIVESLERLKNDIAFFNPNLTLLLGNTAFKVAKDPVTVHPLKPGKTGFRHSVSTWRGTVLTPSAMESPLFGRKCMGSYHPAAVLRMYEFAPMLQFDLKKARREADYPELRLPQREIYLPKTAAEMVALLDQTRADRKLITMDIEGYVHNMSCYSVANSPSYAYVIPFSKGGGNYFENEQDEIDVWSATARLLSDPNVPKCLQNSLYDRFVLQYGHRIVVRNVVDDTMLKHWELYCELEKALDVQASIYTDEPYYKFERKSDNHETHLIYCGKDSAVTHEINDKLEPKLRACKPSMDHYRLNVALLNPLLYMELRGIRYDMRGAKEIQTKLRQEMYSHQHDLDSATGFGVNGLSVDAIHEARREVMCYKRNPNLIKKPYESDHARVIEILKETLTVHTIGELSTKLEKHLNVESPKQLASYLYDTLKMPIQTGKEGAVTTDEGALLRLRKKANPSSLGHTAVHLCIQIRRLGTQIGMLEIREDPDGRVRCGYNIVGTDTGRLSCYTSPTGSGYNLQTIPAEFRRLFRADEGFEFFQCDLAGADGWTVAAHMALLGDTTMLEDLYAGIKPAKVLCLGLRGKTKYLNPNCPREEVAEACKEVRKEDWDYFACKIGQHGTCYLMGKILLAKQIFEESDGAVDLKPSQTEELQNLFGLRYKYKRWHEATARRLASSPTLTAASGHRRVFFGRRDEILGAALAYEPQANTTYATNLAAWRLWTDPDNRYTDSRGRVLLRAEPLHQVHDALCGQFPKTHTDWSVGKIKSWFNNPLVIAGQRIVIPFEGHYGPSWGEQIHNI